MSSNKSLNDDDISWFLDQIPDDGDINSDFDDDFETLEEDVISPLDFYNNVDEVQNTVDIDLDTCGEFICEVVRYNITNYTNKQKNVLHICLEFVYAVDGDETINLNENNVLNNEAAVVDEGKNVCKKKSQE